MRCAPLGTGKRLRLGDLLWTVSRPLHGGDQALPPPLAAQVPSFDSKVAMLLLEAELGGPWTDFYSELSPKPIAAASLGQVLSFS